MELLPTKININEFIKVSIEKINEFHKLIKDGKDVPSNMHKYRLYNTLQYYSIEWDEQRRRIKSTGISKYFDDIVVCSDIGVYKPTKEAFLYLVHKYKIEPSSCLYIGDSEEYDIEGAKNAGLFAVRVCHGNRSRIESTADFVCDGFDELLSFLENCFGVYV